MMPQAELEARLDFDEELPPLDTKALGERIGALGQQVQVCYLMHRLNDPRAGSVIPKLAPCPLRQHMMVPMSGRALDIGDTSML